MIGSPENPVAVVKTGPFLDLVAVDTGSSPGKGDDVEVTLVVLHLDDAMLVLESDSLKILSFFVNRKSEGFTRILNVLSSK